MFICELCGKETPSNESYISEDGFRICEKCAQNTNAIKDEYIEIEEVPEEVSGDSSDEKNKADKAEQESAKPKKLTKKEKKFQKQEERREEEERKGEERYQARLSYAENHGMFAESLSYEDILEWNNYNEIMAAAHFIKLNEGGYNADMVNQSSQIIAHNTEILIRQNELIIRLLKELSDK